VQYINYNIDDRYCNIDGIFMHIKTYLLYFLIKDQCNIFI